MLQKEFTIVIFIFKASSLLGMKLCQDKKSSKKIPISQSGLDILIIPQASLAGKAKNGMVQFHALVEKEEGKHLYEVFVQSLEAVYKAKYASSESHKENPEHEISVKSGVYGNRQGLRFVSDGPNSNFFEF